MTEVRVIDNRIFLLGLDYLYRELIKKHERGELLQCARQVIAAHRAEPLDIPVEGYYSEDGSLSEYFRLMRTFQRWWKSVPGTVESCYELQRLREVCSAPLYGRPVYNGALLPQGEDSLTQALYETYPNWSVVTLKEHAFKIAHETDDISLAGLAARVQDEVVLAAVRESTALYSLKVIGATLNPPIPQYVWQVDEGLLINARRFIKTFNTLFHENMPPAEPQQADRYWSACKRNNIMGRCIHLGLDDVVQPVRHYHWAVHQVGLGRYAVQDFWNTDIWTTERYCSETKSGRCQLII